MRLPRSRVPRRPLVLHALGVRRARTAVIASFSVSGVAFASLISRAPGIRDALGLSPAQLGLLLLCLSGGAIIGLPLSGRIVHRLGPAPAVLAASLTVTTGLLPLAAGLQLGVVVPVAVGFVVAGLGVGIWDVAMNVAGADVERRLGRSLMPRLHAAFSLGTAAGAGVGAASAATGVPLAVQVFAVAALVAASMAVAVRFFLPGDHDAVQDPAAGCGSLVAWREPRTLLIGLLVFGFAFIEGSANDWMAVAMVDGYGTSEAVGAIGFGLFVSAMTVGRLVGSSALDRFGRVAVLRATAITTAAGVLLVVLGGSTVLALVGAMLWGLGASLGFPVGISAAADDPVRAAARVSVVSSIGYAAFLAGPPLIGLLAESSGILRALLVVLGALTLGLLASGASRPLGATPVRL
jgi:predicted MFS family arabinose efflux permease